MREKVETDEMQIYFVLGSSSVDTIYSSKIIFSGSKSVLCVCLLTWKRHFKGCMRIIMVEWLGYRTDYYNVVQWEVRSLQ